MYTFIHKIFCGLQYLIKHITTNDIRDNNKCFFFKYSKIRGEKVVRSVENETIKEHLKVKSSSIHL